MKRVILLMFFVILFTQSQVHALAQTLVTESYKITINNQCEEGEVSCDNILFNSTSLKTGETLTINGSTNHTPCADGVTPCHFVGYEFQTDTHTYLVLETGIFLVFQVDGELVVEENGGWKEE